MQPGDVLVRQGEPCDSLFVVLHGRLREMIGVPDEEARWKRKDDRAKYKRKAQRPSFSTERYFIHDVQKVGSCAVAGGTCMLTGEREKSRVNGHTEWCRSKKLNDHMHTGSPTLGDTNNHNIDVKNTGVKLSRQMKSSLVPHTTPLSVQFVKARLWNASSSFILLLISVQKYCNMSRNISMRLVDRMKRTSDIGSGQRLLLGQAVQWPIYPQCVAPYYSTRRFDLSCRALSQPCKEL